MKVGISGVMEYANRLIAMVDVQMNGHPYRTMMYRSTGTNVEGKNIWFPTNGITEYNRKIGKDLILSDPEKTVVFPTTINSERDHANPVLRLNAFSGYNVPFNVQELSAAVGMEYAKKPVQPMASFPGNTPPESLSFLNTWINEGMRSIRNERSELLFLEKEERETLSHFSQKM